MLDLLIKNASLPDGRQQMSVGVKNGKIVEVSPGLTLPAAQTLDAQVVARRQQRDDWRGARCAGYSLV